MSARRKIKFQGVTFNLYLVLVSTVLFNDQLVTCAQQEKPRSPPGSTSSSKSPPPPSPPSPEVDEMAVDDFHHLTDKLTKKIMNDIEIRKQNDPDWGDPQKMKMDEGLTEEEMKENSECEFHCPPGESQVDDESFKIPNFKNCKKYDRSWDKIPGASKCCTAHLRCYHTCARERMQCDSEFGMCMENICEELQDAKKIVTKEVIEACHSALGLLGMMIMEPGCKLYPKAQDAACRCVSTTSQQDTDIWDSPFGNHGNIPSEKGHSASNASLKEENKAGKNEKIERRDERVQNESVAHADSDKDGENDDDNITEEYVDDDDTDGVAEVENDNEPENDVNGDDESKDTDGVAEVENDNKPENNDGSQEVPRDEL